MSLWDMRQAIESLVPASFVLGIVVMAAVVLVVFEVIASHRGRKHR